MTDCTDFKPSRKRVKCQDPPWNENSSEWILRDREIPEDHIARQIVEAMESLDLSPLYESYSGSGSDPVRPDLMLRIVFIEKQRGRHRPSQWHADLPENLVLQWAGLGIRPARSVWYEFRDRLGRFLDTFFEQTLALALDSRLTNASQAAMDGSTIAAAASRHRLLNRKRLERRLEHLAEACRLDETAQAVEKKGLGWQPRRAVGGLNTRDIKSPKSGCRSVWRRTPAAFPPNGWRRIVWSSVPRTRKPRWGRISSRRFARSTTR
jgi:transposase